MILFKNNFCATVLFACLTILVCIFYIDLQFPNNSAKFANTIESRVNLRRTFSQFIIIPEKNSHLIPEENNPLHSLQDKSEKYVSKLLRHILVFISFHWNSTKLIFIEESLKQILSYETNVSVIIMTDGPIAMANAISVWGFSRFVRIWNTPQLSAHNSAALLWKHRNLIEKILKNESFTTFVGFEDDVRFSWASLQSWAIDTDILLPSNFRRCFFSIQYGTSENINMADWVSPLKITAEVNLIDLKTKDQKNYEVIMERINGQVCGFLRNGSVCKCKLHHLFVSPDFHHQAMWVATKSQFAVFMALDPGHNYGAYKERASSIFSGIDIPDGFPTNCMLPVMPLNSNHTMWVLSELGGVEHMSQKESGGFGKLFLSNTQVSKLSLNSDKKGQFLES